MNWFTGGNDLVEGKIDLPGFYLAEATLKDIPIGELGPEVPIATLTKLHWLGTRSQFKTRVSKEFALLDPRLYAMLMQMLSRSPWAGNLVTSSSDEERESPLPETKK